MDHARVENGGRGGIGGFIVLLLFLCVCTKLLIWSMGQCDFEGNDDDSRSLDLDNRRRRRCIPSALAHTNGYLSSHPRRRLRPFCVQSYYPSPSPASCHRRQGFFFSLSMDRRRLFSPSFPLCGCGRILRPVGNLRKPELARPTVRRQ